MVKSPRHQQPGLGRQMEEAAFDLLAALIQARYLKADSKAMAPPTALRCSIPSGRYAALLCVETKHRRQFVDSLLSRNQRQMKRKADFMVQNVGGENLLVPLGAQVMDLNGLFILNDTAAWVWELLAAEVSLDELSSAVAEQFGVDHETAHADVRTFVDGITRLGLLEK